MRASSERQITITLVLDEQEAMWLQCQMCNPIMPVPPDEVDQETDPDHSYRLAFLRTLNRELDKGRGHAPELDIDTERQAVVNAAENGASKIASSDIQCHNCNTAFTPKWRENQGGKQGEYSDYCACPECDVWIMKDQHEKPLDVPTDEAKEVQEKKKQRKLGPSQIECSNCKSTFDAQWQTDGKECVAYCYCPHCGRRHER